MRGDDGDDGDGGDDGRVRRARARAQGLAGGIRETTVAGVLGRVFAVQAQDAAAAALGLRVRARGLTAEDVARATDVERTAVRGWFMRGTLHLVPAADVRWLLALLGPVFVARSARRYRELGLEESLCERAERLITTAVDGEGPLTRAELTQRLTSLGVEPTGQSAFHLIRRAALMGRVCHGPQRAGQATFVLLDDWLPTGPTAEPPCREGEPPCWEGEPPCWQGDPAHWEGEPPRWEGEPPCWEGDPRRWEGEQAVTELARRYRAAHGPSTAADFAHWSGLGATVCRRAWAAVAEQQPDLPDSDPYESEHGEPDVRLIPAYDDYLLAYRSRDLSVPTAHERQVLPGGGQIRPTVLADGRAIGTWSRETRTGDVHVTPFEAGTDPLRDVSHGITTETADIAHFYGAPQEARPSR